MITTLLKYLLPLVKSLGAAALTPVLEKNIVKTLAMDSPLVVSMSRLIAMAFAAVMLREFWRTGIDGWPDATVGIATVLALPVMNALQRAKPEDIAALSRLLLTRLRGADPSKFDDHRPD